MKASGAIIHQAAGDLQLERIAGQIGSDLSLLAPEELVGDLLLLLSQPQAAFAAEISDSLKDYAWMLGEISHGQRWQLLLKSILRGMRKSKVTPESVQNALRFVTEALARSLQTIRGTGSLEELARKYMEMAEDERDKSALLVTDFILLMAEFARRGESYDFLHALLDNAPAQLCLTAIWDQEEYEPRMLEIVHLTGEKDERLPGDLFGVRGVTVKTREDQLRDVLPSEFAPLHYNADGRRLVVDKLLNRSPLIFEHFDTTQPESSHRALIMLIAGAGRPWGHVPLKWMTPLARSRLAVFEMAFDLAQKVPREHVRADIAILVKEDAWRGAFFPLEVMQGREQAWRNVLEMDTLLPAFFARFSLANQSRREGVELFTSDPGACLARLLAGGVYRSANVAAFGRADEVAAFLPPPSISLPSFDRQTPAVILGCFEDEDAFVQMPGADEDGGDAAEEAAPEIPEGSVPPWVVARARELGGGTFRDLLSAHVAPRPLPETTLAELSAELLAMVIGPLREAKSVDVL